MRVEVRKDFKTLGKKLAENARSVSLENRVKDKNSTEDLQHQAS